MARYTGPKWKISRRENADVFDDDKWRKRPFPPGQNSMSRTSRPTNYSIQFREKQKVKRTYGLLEKQFKNLYVQASKARGNTGTRLLQMLEMRLDNVVYRMKMANTRTQARQFVNHGHIYVNGNKVDIPSYILSVGDVVEYRPKFAKKDVVKIIAEEKKQERSPSWIKGSEVASVPTRDMIDQTINEQLIIEFYSR